MDRRTLMVTGACAGFGLASSAPAEAKAVIGQPAPKFSLTTFDHRHIKMADLYGKVIVLNYWAVWCGPCKAELPMIDAYVRKRGGDDLKVFAVTVDNAVSDSALKPLADVLSFPLVTRIDSFSYGTIDNGVPTNYVIGRDGILRYAKALSFSYDSFAATVGPLLAEPAPPPLSTGASRS